MGSISEDTAFRIVTNPHDLQITFTKRNDSDAYGFLIIYGPKERYNMIFMSDFFAKSKGECLEGLREVLEKSCEMIIIKTGGTDGIISVCEDDSPQNVRITSLMDQNTINWILFELEHRELAATFKMKKY